MTVGLKCENLVTNVENWLPGSIASADGSSGQPNRGTKRLSLSETSTAARDLQRSKRVFPPPPGPPLPCPLSPSPNILGNSLEPKVANADLVAPNSALAEGSRQ